MTVAEALALSDAVLRAHQLKVWRQVAAALVQEMDALMSEPPAASETWCGDVPYPPLRDADGNYYWAGPPKPQGEGE